MRGVRVPGAEPGIKGVRGMIYQKTYPCEVKRIEITDLSSYCIPQIGA
jgi:hypothetical protein